MFWYTLEKQSLRYSRIMKQGSQHGGNMITIDFDSASTPSGSRNVSCILNCGKIRLQARGTPKEQNMRFVENKKTGLKDCIFLKGEKVKGIIVIEGLRGQNFKVMIRDKDYSDKNAKVFSAKQVLFLPDEFKDWTGTLKK